MRVALLGRPEVEWASTYYMAGGLEQGGHQVAHIDMRNANCLSDLEEFEPELTIVCKGTPHFNKDQFTKVNRISKGRVHLFWMDTFHNWRPENSYAVKDLQWPWSVTGSMVKERIEHTTHSLRGCVIPQGPYFHTDNSFIQVPPCRTDSKIPERGKYLLFFGSNSMPRKAVFHAIRDIPVRRLELTWGGDLQEEILKAAAVLSINNTDDVISVRLQTVLAMGGVVIQQWQRDLDRHFGDLPPAPDGLQNPLFSWKTIDQLRTVIQLALRGPPVWRGPAAGYADFVRRKFNWELIMTRAIEHARQYH